MKFYSLIVCIFLLSVDAQRRSVKSELLSENEPAPRSARRGRARFTVTSDAADVEEPKISQPAGRRLVSRRRPESHSEARRAYEVDEVVDDVPVPAENFRRYKGKVVTENKYEAQNAAPSQTLFQPATTENLDEIIKNIGSDLADTTFSPTVSSSTVSSNVEQSASEITSEVTKPDNEINKVVPESTTPLSTRNTPRSNFRSRSNGVASIPTIASRVRARARPSARQEDEESLPSPKLVSRGSRRRPESSATGEISRTRASSFTAESIPTRSRFQARARASPTASVENAEVPTRSRFEARTRTPVASSAGTTEAPVRSRFEARTRAPVIDSAESVELPTRSRFEPKPRAASVSADKVEQPRRVRVETRTRGPSVIASADSSELPSRSRSGRRIGTASRRSEEVKAPERVPIDLTYSRTSNARQNVEATSARSRSRARFQETPPVIDEQKLEVLPLFERETKTVKPVVRKVVTRRRNLSSAEEVEMSATEDDVKVAKKATKESVIVETRTEASIKRRKVTIKPISRTTRSTVVSTKATVKSTKPTIRSTKPTIKFTKPTVKFIKSTQVQTSKPVIKESVISEVTEVTSKRTITRSKERVKVVSVKPFSRGSRKPEVNSTSVKKNKSGLTSSEEEIEDSDNYPEPFKALIQAKKQKKESRSSQEQRLTTASPAVTKSTEKVVISSPSTPTQVISSEANRQLEDSENELDPPKVKPTRRRFASSTDKITRPTRKNKFNRSTSAPPVPTTEHRFHAKFNTDTEATSNNPVKSRSFSPKPPRGLYSSRKTKESLTKNKITTQIPIPKKVNRYSSRYRNDPSTRGAIRTSTNAPAYLPTIPTITPSTTSVKSSLSYQDKDLGVEVISFDDPVNTVPSANLVSGEYVASSTENDIISPLVSASQTKTTEKPVSIIERIINSITAISTTEVPDVSKRMTSSPDKLATKESAILKLATKKSTRLDKIQTTQKIPTVTVTSEKPTTIIQRILSSLSAIQADNATDTKYSKSKQVGTNFNTISSPSTTPLTRVTKSTLYAPISTTVNPLFALDDIADEQILQKRTIDKLLVLLNTLTSPHPPQPTPLVVVTPKTTSYVVGSSATATTVPPTTTTTITTTTSSTTTELTTTTTKATESSTATTNQLFTSPVPNVIVNSRSFPAIRYTTTPTTTQTTPVTTRPVVTTTTQTPILTSTEAVTTSQVPTTNPTLTSTATATTSPIPTSTVGTTDISNEIGALPLSLESGVTSSPSVTETPSSTDFSSTTTDSTPSTESSTFSSTEFTVDTETNFAFPSTIPTIINFEVSRGSVSVFNANDLSNAITRDYPSTTVTISGRANFPDNSVTTQVTISTEMTTSSPNSDNVTTENSVTVQNSTSDGMTENSTGTTTSSPEITSVPTTGTTMSPGTTVTTELPSMTTTDSSGSSNTTQDISSNIIDTTNLSAKSNQTSTVDKTNTTSRASSRSGRLLNLDPEPVLNSLEASTPPPKDYFIFAVLNNNTVLRKRPSKFPTKDTPYLIVGVYPNNTIIRRFPNGSMVPMEPVIRVDQNTVPPFEANPLSLSSVNNATSTTGTVSSSTASSIQANPLSISSISSTTTEISTSTSTSSSSSSTAAPTKSTTSATTTSSTAPTATLPTLTEILNGRTVQAFNNIINISDLSKVKTLEVDPKTKIITTTLPTPTLSNRILDDPISSTMLVTSTTTQLPTTTMPPTTTIPPRTTTPPKTTTTNAPTTTITIPTTIPPSTPATFISTRGTTVLPLSQPATTTFRTTTSFPSTTFLPQFLTTFFSTLRPRKESTEPPLTIVTPVPNRVRITTPRVEISTGGDLVTAASTRRTVRTTTEPPTTILSTLPISTTRMSRRRTTTMTTTTPQPTTTILTTTLAGSSIGRNARGSTEEPTTTTDGTKRLRQLTDQQKKDLQTLAQLEMEQATILKQLAFLTNLNFANMKPTTDKNDLANRIVALAVERDKERLITTTLPPITTFENKRKAKKISTSSEQSIEELLKQLNIVTPSTLTTDYGKSNDAVIAALLKEQGIGPTTPEALGDIYSHTTTTTRRPKPTTRRPGPLMQSLSWLLNVLAPPTTKRPRAKPKSKKPKPTPSESQEEILTHQPTHITPVVTQAPRQNLASALSQTDIQKLIKQLEEIQKDPQNSKGLDFSSINSLQNLLNVEEGVRVTSIGTTGTTTRETTPVTTTTARRKGKSRVVKSTTILPLSVSNSIDEEEFPSTTTRTRATLPPVRLRPVPGIEEDGTLVRGQLVNAAVNVTRAISSFLGTALQDAAFQFRRLLTNGSSSASTLRNYFSTSSVLSNVANLSSTS